MLRIISVKKMALVLLVVAILVLAFFVAVPAYLKSQLGDFASNVEVVGISAKEVSVIDAEVDVTMRVTNPYPIGATITRIAYNLYYRDGEAWSYLGQADQSDSITLGGHDVIDITLTNDVATLSAVKMLLSTARQGGEITLRGEGTVWLKFGPFNFSVPFDQSRTVSLGI